VGRRLLRRRGLRCRVAAEQPPQKTARFLRGGRLLACGLNLRFELADPLLGMFQALLLDNGGLRQEVKRVLIGTNLALDEAVGLGVLFRDGGTAEALGNALDQVAFLRGHAEILGSAAITRVSDAVRVPPGRAPDGPIPRPPARGPGWRCP